MQNIVEEFNSYYQKNLNHKDLLPSFVTEYFNTEACLVFSEAKRVYVVSDISFNRKYILKQVSGQYLSQSEVERDMLASLNHPSIPKVCKWYTDDSHTYLIREFFEGITLDAYILGNGPVGDDEAIDLAIQICDLLMYLHGQNPPVIHRDIKPQNLVLRTGGKIGMIDFETSRRYNRQAVTDTVYMGTIQTAAPEQFGYGQTDQQTDIYALGILLIYLKTGGYDRADSYRMSPRLKKIAEKCTEFSPKDRYKNVDDVKKQLLDKRNTVFSKTMIVGLSALFVGIMILSGSLTAIYLARQAKSTNYEETENVTSENTGIGETENVYSTDTEIEETKGVSSTNPDIEETKGVSSSTSDIEETKGVSSGNPDIEETKVISTTNPGIKETENISSDATGTEEMEISFRNAGIEKAVRDILGKTKGEPLSKLELGQITSLEIIGDLQEPIVYEELQHDYNSNRIAYKGEYLKRGPVDSLEDLALLPSLSELTLVYQQLSDLSGIEKLKYPVMLSLAYNHISDLTLLKDMESLSFLRINCNPIKDLSPLKNLSRLSYLQIAGTYVDDLSPLSSLEALTTLDIWGMTELDLAPLKDLKNLKDIYIK